MKRRYKLSKEAEKDLDSIKSYLLEEAGGRVARYVLKELKEGMQFISDAPDAGHMREDLTDTPVKFWPVFSYLIIYDSQARPIEIVRVLHGGRDVATIL